MVTGTSVQGSKDALRLARLYAGTLYCTAGMFDYNVFSFPPPFNLILFASQSKFLLILNFWLFFCFSFVTPLWLMDRRPPARGKGMGRELLLCAEGDSVLSRVRRHRGMRLGLQPQLL